jgi:UDP-N-acetyl-D-galactosamine dehydrogenase
MLGGVISKGDTIIYESTVYPGATEEECIPIVEKVSGLTFNKDFFAGYSPERINPGDKKHRLANILKVTSGSNEEISYKVDDLYNTIVTAGTHRASSIKVAEASKVIENVQRDVNIALINELHQIFSKLDINTKEVIEAASTKWNFMKLMPGLVGGHCIGVDPYYLLHKAQGKGFVPDLIRAAREVNDSMADFLIQDFISSLLKRKINPVGLRVLLLGFTFKENCPDIRNTKVIDIYNKLNSVGFIVDVYDPWVDVDEAMKEYDLEILKEIPTVIDVGFMAVGHDKILELVSGPELKLAKNYIFDYKNLIVE